MASIWRFPTKSWGYRSYHPLIHRIFHGFWHKPTSYWGIPCCVDLRTAPRLLLLLDAAAIWVLHLGWNPTGTDPPNTPKMVKRMLKWAKTACLWVLGGSRSICIYIYIIIILLYIIIIIIIYIYIYDIYCYYYYCYYYVYIWLYKIIRFVREITFDLGDSLTISVKAIISDRRFLLWRGNDHDSRIGQSDLMVVYWWFNGGWMGFNGI